MMNQKPRIVAAVLADDKRYTARRPETAHARGTVVTRDHLFQLVMTVGIAVGTTVLFYVACLGGGR